MGIITPLPPPPKAAPKPISMHRYTGIFSTTMATTKTLSILNLPLQQKLFLPSTNVQSPGWLKARQSSFSLTLNLFHSQYPILALLFSMVPFPFVSLAGNIASFSVFLPFKQFQLLLFNSPFPSSQLPEFRRYSFLLQAEFILPRWTCMFNLMSIVISTIHYKTSKCRFGELFSNSSEQFGTSVDFFHTTTSDLPKKAMCFSIRLQKT